VEPHSHVQSARPRRGDYDSLVVRVTAGEAECNEDNNELVIEAPCAALCATLYLLDQAEFDLSWYDLGTIFGPSLGAA